MNYYKSLLFATALVFVSCGDKSKDASIVENPLEEEKTNVVSGLLPYNESGTSVSQPEPEAKITFVTKRKVKLNDFIIEKTRQGIKVTSMEKLQNPYVRAGFNGAVYVFYRDPDVKEPTVHDGGARFELEKTSKNTYETERIYLPNGKAYSEVVSRLQQGHVTKQDIDDFDNYVFTMSLNLDKEYTFKECEDKFCDDIDCKMFRFLLSGILLK